MKVQRFPPGWDEHRVREVIEHSENQGEDAHFAEIEACHEDENAVFMAVPVDLVPQVSTLIAQRQGD